MIKFFQHTAVEPRDKELFNKFYEAVSQKADDVRITSSGIYQSCSVAVIWGSWKKLSKKEWKFLRAPHHRLKDDIVKKHGQRPLVIIETPILGRTIGKYHKYYRVSLNHYLNNLGQFNNKDCKSDRFDSLNLTIKPWRTNGKHILVLGQNLNDASLLGADMELWTITTLKHLLKVTDRKIHFRDHPENGSKLKDVLEKNFYGIKQIVYDTFPTQNRAVTQSDYESLCYRMPGKFGNIKRVSAQRDPNSLRRNINLYVISEDEFGKLIVTNNVIKNNLKWIFLVLTPTNKNV